MDGFEKRTSRSRRVLIESVVIIASILAAFAIDAWWEQLGDDEQARAFLAALAEDLDGARADLERVKDLHERITASANRIMTWAEAPDPRALCEAADDPYMFLLAHPSFDPPMGTIETILGSGRVDLLRNRALLRELTRWSSIVTDLRQDELRANDHLERELYPLLRDELDLKSTIRTGPYVWPGATDESVPCDLITSRQFQSAIYRHWAWHQVVLQEGIPPVSEAIENASRLVHAELSR